MMEKLVNIFLDYKQFIIISIAIITILFISMILMDINYKKSKIIFPILFNIKNIDIFRLSLLITKYLLALYVLFSNFEINFSILTIFIIIDSLYNIVHFNILGAVFDYINSMFLFATIFGVRLIKSYILEVKFTYSLAIIDVLLIIFLISYLIYTFGVKLLKVNTNKEVEG